MEISQHHSAENCLKCLNYLKCLKFIVLFLILINNKYISIILAHFWHFRQFRHWILAYISTKQIPNRTTLTYSRLK